MNYYTMRDHILWSLPYPARILVGLIIYRSTTSHLHGQGTGRYSPEEIAAFRLDIWEHISRLLAASKAKAVSHNMDPSAPFWAFGGDQPTEADATLFGFLVSVLICNAYVVLKILVEKKHILIS
jgi:hypothetical protein